MITNGRSSKWLQRKFRNLRTKSSRRSRDIIRRVVGPDIRALNRISGALLPERCRLLLCDQPGQSNQVVGGATEDEQPVHFLQPSQLYLSQRAGLLQPTKSLFHQPSAA